MATARHAEFVHLAEEAREEGELMGRLRRRATIARKGIAQILETAPEYGFRGRGVVSAGPPMPRASPGRSSAPMGRKRGHGPRRRESGAAPEGGM